jgi:hypothetical protein
MTLLPSRDRDRRARMTTMAVRPSRKPPQNPFLTTTTPDELPPAQRLAYDIVAERRDLTPSVTRIMNAGLTEDDTVGALTLFRSALGVPGDRNRDPRIAIAAYGGVTAESPTAT